MSKRRLDTLLVDRGLAESREKARALVMAGQVLVDERPAPKPGSMIDESLDLHVVQGPAYVSRGGEKLAHALESFSIDVRDVVAADIGASTGGFTDCLLKNGASKVYAVDVGKAQLAYGLRTDPRVVVLEGVNARDMAPLPELVDLITIDVSFISLRLVLPRVARLLGPSPSHRPVVALFKPQFEAAKDEVPRGGVIRDAQLHAALLGRFNAWCMANDFAVVDMVSSPILGAEGNREFLLCLRPR